MNLHEIEVEELAQDDVQSVSGGSFGHDVGVLLRFEYMQAVYGYEAAVADYAYNTVKCGC